MRFSMFDFLSRPVRTHLFGERGGPRRSVRTADPDPAAMLNAIETAANSIERYAEAAAVLASSLQPLTASVDQLTQATAELADLVAAIRNAEHGVEGPPHVSEPSRGEQSEPRANGHAGS